LDLNPLIRPNFVPQARILAEERPRPIVVHRRPRPDASPPPVPRASQEELIFEAQDLLQEISTRTIRAQRILRLIQNNHYNDLLNAQANDQ
jgi:hypothetical protein